MIAFETENQLLLHTQKEKSPEAQATGLFYFGCICKACLADTTAAQGLMASRSARPCGDTDALNHFLHFNRWWRSHLTHRIGDNEVDNRTDGTNGIWLDTEPAVVTADKVHELGALDEQDTFVRKHVDQRRRQTSDHTRNGTFAVHGLGEDTHQDSWEQ